MLLEKCRLYLRKSSSSVLDEEIQDHINACLQDLKLAGILNQDETDPLIIQAVTTYVRCNFGYENKEYERFKQAYDSIKLHLSLCSEYTEEVQ